MDMDCVSSIVGSEGSPSLATRARGRRGGRRQKRVGGEGGAVAAVGGGAGGSLMLQQLQGDGGALATSMALAAIQDD
jgi:hypothetical protein